MRPICEFQAKLWTSFDPELAFSSLGLDHLVAQFLNWLPNLSQNIRRIRLWNYLPRRVKTLVSKYFETDFNFWAMKIYQSPNEFISSISPYKITRLFNRTVSCVFWWNPYSVHYWKPGRYQWSTGQVRMSPESGPLTSGQWICGWDHKWSKMTQIDRKLIARHGSLDGYFDISRNNFDIDKSLTFLVICY